MQLLDRIYSDDHERCRLDVFRPNGAGPFPVVVVIHGGGWLEGSKCGERPYAEILNSLGYAAVLPGYRLATDVAHPAQRDDVLAVLDWVGAHAREFDGDAQRTGMCGVSAGGHLAALAGLMASRRPTSAYRIRAVLPVCGVFDVARWLADCPQYLMNVTALVGGPPALRSEAVRDASPTSQVHAGAPPFCLMHGEADTVVPPNQSLIFRDALAAAGVSVECHIVPGEPHTALEQVRRTGEPLGGLDAFRGFFARHL